MANFKQSRNYCGRAVCYSEFKDYSAALKDLTEAIRLCPDYAMPYYFYKAKAYESMQNRAAAAAERKKAANLPPLPKFMTQYFSRDKGFKDAVAAMQA